LTNFTSLGIDKCPYEIIITEWTNDSVVPQNGADNTLLANNVTVIGYYV